MRALVLLGASAGLGAVVLPMLVLSTGAARRGAAATAARLARERTATESLEARAALVAAPLARRAALDGSAARAEAVLRALASIVDSSPEGLRLTRMSLTVAGGSAAVRLHAEAPDAATARGFLIALARAPRVREARQTAINGNGRGGVELDVSLTTEVGAP